MLVTFAHGNALMPRRPGCAATLSGAGRLIVDACNGACTGTGAGAGSRIIIQPPMARPITTIAAIAMPPIDLRGRAAGTSTTGCGASFVAIVGASCEIDITVAASLASRSYSATRVASFVTSEVRSEEHTSELQSQSNLVCRLLLEKK